MLLILCFSRSMADLWPAPLQLHSRLLLLYCDLFYDVFFFFFFVFFICTCNLHCSFSGRQPGLDPRPSTPSPSQNQRCTACRHTHTHTHTQTHTHTHSRDLAEKNNFLDRHCDQPIPGLWHHQCAAPALILKYLSFMLLQRLDKFSKCK